MAHDEEGTVRGEKVVGHGEEGTVRGEKVWVMVRKELLGERRCGSW